MQRISVGVLRGGPSSEYEVSLESGATVLAELDRSKYEPKDIFISRNGEWHVHGMPMSPERALRHIDVVFNAMHGEYGEDGTVQRLLDTFGVPYTGSEAMASAVAFNKQRTKDIVEKLGVRVPRGIVVEPTADHERQVIEVFRTFGVPAMVKPLIGGSSVGMTLARDFEALSSGFSHAFEVSPKILVEEYIKGREATAGVIDSFRGHDIYPLLPIEIILPAASSFFDYDAKYKRDDTKYICPGGFSSQEKSLIQQIAQKVHRVLGLRHYSQSDFIISPRGIYFLEVNSLPSPWPEALEAIGTKLSDFFDHLISLARTPKSALRR